jgi:hypothetical protein
MSPQAWHDELALWVKGQLVGQSVRYLGAFRLPPSCRPWSPRTSPCLSRKCFLGLVSIVQARHDGRARNAHEILIPSSSRHTRVEKAVILALVVKGCQHKLEERHLVIGWHRWCLFLHTPLADPISVHVVLLLSGIFLKLMSTNTLVFVIELRVLNSPPLKRRLFRMAINIVLLHLINIVDLALQVLLL